MTVITNNITITNCKKEANFSTEIGSNNHHNPDENSSNTERDREEKKSKTNIDQDDKNAGSSIRKKQNRMENKKPEVPSLPEGWDRCQAYNKKKHRYCRQVISPNIPQHSMNTPRFDKAIYCGNHYHLYLQSQQEQNAKLHQPQELAPTTNEALDSQSETASSPNFKKQKILNTPLDRPNIGEKSTVNKNITAEGPNNQKQQKRKKKEKGKRIPCPIDPTHLIYENQVDKHIKICPLAKQQREERTRFYFRENVNRGGMGRTNCNKKGGNGNVKGNGDFLETGLEESNKLSALDTAKELAMRVLDAYDRLFIRTHVTAISPRGYNEKYLKSLTYQQIYDGIPHVDKYECENENKQMERDLELHRIKLGGPKHVRQIGSIVGHFRADGLFDSTCSDEKKYHTKFDAAITPRIVLEMGAGRGTTGYVLASALAASASKLKTGDSNDSIKHQGRNEEKDIQDKVQLVMVERSGSRAKADRVFRRMDGLTLSKKKDKNKNIDTPQTQRYLNVEGVDVTRIKCDLAHVHLPSALQTLNNKDESASKASEPIPETATTTKASTESLGEIDTAVEKKKRNTLVVAKHLCGAGTDLALKSMSTISDRIRGCALATCCHGLCNWDDYIGRDYLRKIMMDRVDASDDNDNGVDKEKVGDFQLGSKEFSIMARWTSGSVLKLNDNEDESNITMSASDAQEDADDYQHYVGIHSDGDGCSISTVVKELGLKCGPRGLGRACQRLIDYGRCQYMRDHLFHSFTTIKDKKHEKCGGSTGIFNSPGTDDGVVVNMCYYVNENVTPQNALLKGFYNK